MCGWWVDEVEEKLRIKKKFNRREAYNLALGVKREVGLFHKKRWLVFFTL